VTGSAARAAPARILDPRAVPVSHIDDDLPPVPADRLTPAALRARFAGAGDWMPEFPGDGRWFDHERTPSPASVLVGIVPRPEGPQVLLTRRAEHLRSHAGQISFPGGRVEPEDADAAATALREAHEEVGLPAERVDVIGTLPRYTTVTHFVVTPVVGIVEPPFDLELDDSEVAEAFEVPLEFLMTPANHRRHLFRYEGGERQFVSMPWRDYYIWGATAAMLRNLYRFLSA